MPQSIEFCFDWDIDLSDFNQKSQSKLYSSDFKCSYQNIGLTWNLILIIYPMNTYTACKRIILIYYKDGSKDAVNAKCKLELIEANNGSKGNQKIDKSDQEEFEYSFRTARKFEKGKEDLWSEFWFNIIGPISPKTHRNFLNGDNTFTIRCTLLIDASEFEFPIKNSIFVVSSASSERISGKKLFDAVIAEGLNENAAHSDVTLISKDRKIFKCHKNILSINCDMFATMFATDLMETKNNAVIINDIDSDTLIELLRYIYTREIGEKFKSLAWDLVYAADKYELYELKQYCELAMHDTVNEKNAVQYLLIADRHNLHIVKNRAISLIIDFYDQIKNESDWNMLINKAPELVAEILDDAAARATVSVRLKFA